MEIWKSDILLEYSSWIDGRENTICSPHRPNPRECSITTSTSCSEQIRTYHSLIRVTVHKVLSTTRYYLSTTWYSFRFMLYTWWWTSACLSILPPKSCWLGQSHCQDGKNICQMSAWAAAYPHLQRASRRDSATLFSTSIWNDNRFTPCEKLNFELGRTRKNDLPLGRK